VDIEISSSNFLIFIEVKVRAPESTDQLKRYVQLVTQKAAGRPTLVIYLTPSGRPPVDSALHDTIVSLSWSRLAELVKAYASCCNSSNLSGRVFNQFAAHALELSLQSTRIRKTNANNA